MVSSSNQFYFRPFLEDKTCMVPEDHRETEEQEWQGGRGTLLPSCSADPPAAFKLFCLQDLLSARGHWASELPGGGAVGLCSSV